MAPSTVHCDHAGVEIHGVELRNLSKEDVAYIREQFNRHGVLFFRDQSLTSAEHLEFAKLFGPININRFFMAVDDYPEIAMVFKDKDMETNIGESFHTDHSYDIEPALGSVLVARELPDHGGDTLFVDMHKAYETLPPHLKNKVEQMNAVHSSVQVFGNFGGATATTLHPVVLTHPASGHKVLYVNPTFTLHFEGMTVAESRPLLEELYYHAARPEHVHRFCWKPGSVAFWDNRATWHSAMNDYHGQRRLMHRVTIEGCKISELNRQNSPHSHKLPPDFEDVQYNPGDDLNVALRQQAVSPAASKL